MKSRNFVKSVVGLLLSMLLYSCHSKLNPQEEMSPNSNGPIQELISTRPINSGPVKLLVRLMADPLAQVPKETRVNQLTLIASQQDQLIEQLRAISPQIEVVYRYKNILNALYLIIPENLISAVEPILPSGSRLELTTDFRRPEVKVSEVPPSQIKGDFKAHNSVKFIGAELLHDQGIRGQGISVGVIDTGIDYTHSMLGGSGLVLDFKKRNPSFKNAQFPNEKVIGGFDFVGTDYDSASSDPQMQIPKPDQNPMDEGGHGTHVAGTISGIGDGVHNYSGVAPDSKLFALKVFGKKGSTDDAVVIAALDYAADPDGLPTTEDHLDVVNLSLGSPYGTPKILYGEAISNLNKIGTMVVASAGNSGNFSYITGAPGVAEEVLSVAASIDDMDHNWHFGAATFQIPNLSEVIAEYSEATFTKPLSTMKEAGGNLVYIGKAIQLTAEQSKAVNGNIALIDRGEIPFSEKVNNAFKAGAIGVVVVNNAPGSPFTMGGGENDKVDIPAIMIGLEPGQIVKDHLAKGEVVSVNLKSDKTIAKPELIDTLTDFSSRGPRSEDSLIKPEISAPGSNIISAKMGGGNEVVSMSGTSMASPHMAGVMALMKQNHQTLNPAELKSLVLLTAKSINDPKGERYPIAQQGAGRVQVVNAQSATLSVIPATLSLGRNEIVWGKTISRNLHLKNLENKDLVLTVEEHLNPSIHIVNPGPLNLRSGEEIDLNLVFKLRAPEIKKFDQELDGFIYLKDQTGKVYSLPVLAMVLKISDISAGSLKVHSSSLIDSVGSLIDLNFKNASLHAGDAYLFQFLGRDELKNDQGFKNRNLSTGCDLESVGYRTVTQIHEGKKVEVLQMALKLYNPLTTWSTCEFSVQIDFNGDGIADQELAGVNLENTKGLGKGMASILLDAEKARSLRGEFESKGGVESYTPALIDQMDLLDFNQSSLMILQTPVLSLKAVAGKNLRVKVGALNLELGTVESDDFLGNSWMDLSLQPEAQTIQALPEKLEVRGLGTQKISLVKGEGRGPIVVYYPYNHGVMTSVGDSQSQILDYEFLGE